MSPIAPVLNTVTTPSQQYFCFSSSNALVVYSKGEQTAQIKEFPEWVRCIAVSSDETQIIVASGKKIFLHDFPTLNLISSVEAEKKPIAMAFTDKMEVLLADKTGRAHKWTNEQQEKSKEFKDRSDPLSKEEIASVRPSSILGHLSVLTDLAYDPSGRVLTSDKDWKIRVSSYPQAYNIENFCLGHTEFISRIILIPGVKDRLVSGSGDGYIRYWDHSTGQELSSVLLPLEESELESIPITFLNSTLLIAARGNKLFLIEIGDQLKIVGEHSCASKVLTGCTFGDLQVISCLDAPYFHIFTVVDQKFVSEPDGLVKQLSQHLVSVDDALKMEILNEKMEQLLARTTANLKEQKKKRRFNNE